MPWYFLPLQLLCHLLLGATVQVLIVFKKHYSVNQKPEQCQHTEPSLYTNKAEISCWVHTGAGREWRAQAADVTITLLTARDSERAPCKLVKQNYTEIAGADMQSRKREKSDLSQNIHKWEPNLNKVQLSLFRGVDVPSVWCHFVLVWPSRTPSWASTQRISGIWPPARFHRTPVSPQIITRHIFKGKGQDGMYAAKSSHFLGFTVSLYYSEVHKHNFAHELNSQRIFPLPVTRLALHWTWISL